MRVFNYLLASLGVAVSIWLTIKNSAGEIDNKQPLLIQKNDLLPKKPPTRLTNVEQAENKINKHPELKKSLSKKVIARQAIEDFEIHAPTIGDIAQLSEEEIHNTPTSLIVAARKLGKIVELENKYSEYQSNFQRVYLGCAKNNNLVFSLRALCLQRFVISSKPSPDSLKKILEDLPSRVIFLFRQL